MTKQLMGWLSPAQGEAGPEDPCSNLAEWMSLSKASFRVKLLDQLVLPGSHDSGAHHLQRGVCLSHSAAGLAAYLLTCLPCIVPAWSLTQSLGLRQQLELGIRCS